MTKTIKTATLCFVMLAAGPGLSAQTNKDEVQLIQSAYGINKREIVKEYIRMSDAEAQKFWPVYDAYESERQKLGKDRINILSEYAMSYDTLRDPQADKLAMATFD